MIGFAPLASGPIASGTIGSTFVSGPQVDTTLTNVSPGTPGLNTLTRKRYLEAIGPRISKLRDGLSDLEIAELDLVNVRAAYDRALFLRSYDDNFGEAIRVAQRKVEALRAAEIKAAAIREAKERIMQQVRDAIAKRRKH